MSNKINPLIMQNRLISQARSRARSRSAGVGSALLGSQGNNKDSLVNALKNEAKNNGMSDADRKAKENYTTMKGAAESLKQRTKNLLLWPSKEWENMSEDEIAEYKSDACKEVGSFVSDYNAMVKSMNNEADSKVNQAYLKQMKGYFANARAALEGLGITQKNDGTLSLDQELLKAADAATIKKFLGQKGSFVDDIGKKAEDVISNAETNLAIINKDLYAGNYSYNKYGSDIFDLLTGGKYNSLG